MYSADNMKGIVHINYIHNGIGM